MTLSPHPQRRAHAPAALCALTLLLVSTHAHALEYVVQPGDTLARIAERFYNAPSAWRRISDANGLDAGRGFRPGDTLFIPEDGDPKHPSASLLGQLGEVTWSDPASPQPQLATKALPLLWQRVVTTGPDALAEFALTDGSHLLLGPGSRLTMLGEVGKDAGNPLLSRVRVRLEGGSIEFFGAADTSTLEVAAPGGIATLTGRHLTFRFGDPAHHAAALSGTVAWAGGVLRQGQGAPLTSRVRPSPLPLPPAVPLLTPDGAPHLLSRIGQSPGPIAQWRPDPTAEAYEVELAAPNTTLPLWQARTGADVTRLSLPFEQSGLLEVRVRAVFNDIPGPWSRAPFVALHLTPASAPIAERDGQPVFMGSAVLHIDRSAPPLTLRAHAADPLGDTLTLSSAAGASIGLVATTPNPAGDAQPAWIARGEVRVQIDPIPDVRVTFAPQQLDPLAPPPRVTVRVRLADLHGNPVTDEAPLVEAGHRTCQATPTATPGEYQCTLKPRAAPGLDKLPLIVTGRGGSFRAELAFDVLLPASNAFGRPPR